MFRKNQLFAVFAFALFALAALAASPARAQMGAQDLPDLSGLADAIAKSAAPPPAPAKGKLFSSGLPVPSVHPGETAKSIARQMREGIEKQGGPNPAMQKLEDAMPSLITGLEAQMVKQGFAKRDLGVATGLFFLGNWETANKQTLTDPAENAVVRAVAATATGKWKARFSTLSPAAKEKTYESLLAGTALLTVFAQTFEKAGKTKDAASIRQTAGVLFEKVVGTPAAQVKISPEGRISSLAPAAPPPAGGPKDAPADKPAASRGVKPSQIAGVYAQQTNRIGVGGSFYLAFEPVLALKDGTYCEDFDVPPSEFNIAASRQRYPKHWSRWRYNAAVGGGNWHGAAKHIQVLSDKGVWETANWIGPLPGGGPGQHLSGTFTATGGGGNTALGGDTMIAGQESFTFLPDGHYRLSRHTSVSTSSLAAGSSRKTSGTYTLSDYAITLRAGDGTVKRWSYARVEKGMVFLQGYPYTSEDDQ